MDISALLLFLQVNHQSPLDSKVNGPVMQRVYVFFVGAFEQTFEGPEKLDALTHYGLVMSYGNIDLGQY